MGRMHVFAVAAVALTACADVSANGLKRMYVLDCGRLVATDQSRWTPGVNAGQPLELSNNCYLFQHERGTLLWETGVPDSVAMQKGGVTAPSGVIVWFRDQTLESQLESLGIAPGDITYVAFSHAHGDHIGNIRDLAQSTLLIQGLEHEFAMNSVPAALSDDQRIERLAGDRDIFGDGSLTIISTPGHTPGHQSLLVTLPETGALVLTGDLVHFQYMWDHKVVPSFNFDQAQSLASIERVRELVTEHQAQLWIGHDKDLTARIGRAPEFYE
jgi:N-acyl homoserine lactone hydrolase